MLGLGAVRLYYAGVIWGLAVLATLFLWREMRAWAQMGRAALHDLCPAFQAMPLIGGMLGVILCLSLLRALAPPVKWDALVYHLTLPKLYAQTHGLQLDMEFMFSGMPQLTEMLYLAAMLLRSPSAAQVVGWAFGALLALGLAAQAQALLGIRWALVAPAVLLISFTLASSLAWAYADLLLMLLGLALLITLRRWALTRERMWLAVSGVLAGLAMGCKYTAALLPLAAVVVVAWHLGRAPGRSLATLAAHFSPAVGVAVIALLVFSPWLIKNLLLTGSPIFPLFLPAGEMDALRQQFYSRPDLADHNLLWATVIFFRALFGGVQGGNAYDATLNPFLALLPLALGLGWRRLPLDIRQGLGSVALFTGVAYMGWVALTFMTPLALQARLFFALFPALALLCAGGFVALTTFDAPTLRVSFLLAVAFGLVCGLSTLEYVVDFVRASPVAYVFGHQSQRDYEEEQLGWYARAMQAVNALPEEARVVFLWEVRSLGCATVDRCAPDVVIDRWWHLRRTIGDTATILPRWKAQGFTHVLIYWSGVEFLQTQANNGYVPADWTELAALRSQLLAVEDFGGAFGLYALP
jgi:hypothetical protein